MLQPAVLNVPDAEIKFLLYLREIAVITFQISELRLQLSTLEYRVAATYA